jgi:hypothetical protein
MTDFVTRLEQELHGAAVREERKGTLRAAALPRLRIAVPGAAAAVLAVAVLALALAGVASVFLQSSPERAALPAELEGQWRLPVELGVQSGQRPEISGNARGENSLRLLGNGSPRCAELGVDSPCYVIDDSVEGAIQWGRFVVSGHEITFTSRADEPPAQYRWRISDGALLLSPGRPDADTERGTALGSGPLTRVTDDETVPEDWTAKDFSSKRYGYRLRFPRQWSATAAATPLPVDGLALPTSDAADRLGADPRGVGQPSLSIAAHPVSRGVTLAGWTKTLNDRLVTTRGCDPGSRRTTTVGGVPANVIVYPNCHRGHQQWALLVHRGQGYQLVWSGEAGEQQGDAKLFQAILETFAFSGGG